MLEGEIIKNHTKWKNFITFIYQSITGAIILASILSVHPDGILNGCLAPADIVRIQEAESQNEELKNMEQKETGSSQAEAKLQEALGNITAAHAKLHDSEANVHEAHAKLHESEARLKECELLLKGHKK